MYFTKLETMVLGERLWLLPVSTASMIFIHWRWAALSCKEPISCPKLSLAIDLSLCMQFVSCFYIDFLWKIHGWHWVYWETPLQTHQKKVPSWQVQGLENSLKHRGRWKFCLRPRPLRTPRDLIFEWSMPGTDVLLEASDLEKKTQSPNCFSSVPGKPGLTNAVSSMDSMFNLEETSPRMMKTLEGMKLVGVELAIICIFRDLNLKVIPASFLGSAPPKSNGVRAKSQHCNSMALWWWGCNRDPRGAPFGEKKCPCLLFQSEGALNQCSIHKAKKPIAKERIFLWNVRRATNQCLAKNEFLVYWWWRCAVMWCCMMSCG